MADIPPSSIPGGAGGYELHQKLRTKVVRLVRKQKYDEAVTVLYDGSTKLLDDHEQGSGVDLALYLLEVYEQAGIKPDETSRGRITTIIGKTNADFWRKKVVGAAVKWACHATNTSAGDAPLRLAIAELFAKEKQYYEAEGHYIAASSENVSVAPQFAKMLAEWNHEYAYAIAEDEPGRAPDTIERVMAGSFSHRGWIPLALQHAPEAASFFLTEYIQQVTKGLPALLLPVKPNPREYKSPASGADAFKTTLYATASPDLNFAQTAVALACDAHKRKGPCPDAIKSTWQSLVRQFVSEGGLRGQEPLLELLHGLSSIYFGAPAQARQGDMLSGMMASLFGGGPGPQGSQPEQPKPIKQLPKPADPVKPKPGAQPAAEKPSEADQLMDEEMD